MHLVLVGAIAEFAALADEESAARAVDGFTIVESALLPMSRRCQVERRNYKMLWWSARRVVLPVVVWRTNLTTPTGAIRHRTGRDFPHAFG